MYYFLIHFWATNIFSNGIATQLFLLSFIAYLNYSSEPNYRSSFTYSYNKYSSILFLIFSALTHKIGIWIVCCLFFSKVSKSLIKAIALIPADKKRLYIPRLLIFNSIPFVIIGIFLVKFASSQYFDITAPIMGFISIIFLIFLLDLVRRLFKINKLSDWQRRVIKSKQFYETTFFALIFTFPGIIFTVLSSSDAAERIVFLSILYIMYDLILWNSKRDLQYIINRKFFKK